MEQWEREEILKHNALMNAALQCITLANGHCSNSQSERLEAELFHYRVCPETGDMKPLSNDEDSK